LQIAILHYAMPPVIGGVEVTIAAHARLLRAHGHAVQLIAGRGDDALLIPEIDSRHPRVEAVQRELKHGNVSAEFHALTRDIFNELEKALRGVDILIAHNVVTLHKNLALTVALHQLVSSQRVKLIAWCHDFAWDDPVYADDLRDGAPWDLLRRAWVNAKYVAVSESRQRDLARLLQINTPEIAVVPPGLDAAEFFRVTETTAHWLETLHLLDGAPLLLLPARVTRRKNIEFAIDIVNALRENGFAPKLLVMGPLGPHNPANRAYLDELKTRAGNNILFLQEHGAVSDATRRDLYALADALLFPSAREGFGIPILEAGIARLPIFCADIPPFRETARDLAHYFALAESPRVIAARLAEFFAADARYQLKQRVRHAYSWEHVFTAHIEPLLNAYAHS
jgi:glycosyltransferase involved in cell wall biosynthesis